MNPVTRAKPPLLLSPNRWWPRRARLSTHLDSTSGLRRSPASTTRVWPRERRVRGRMVRGGFGDPLPHRHLCPRLPPARPGPALRAERCSRPPPPPPIPAAAAGREGGAGKTLRSSAPGPGAPGPAQNQRQVTAPGTGTEGQEAPWRARGESGRDGGTGWRCRGCAQPGMDGWTYTGMCTCVGNPGIQC